MSYKIIGDSCLDLTDKMKNDSHFQMIPLTLQVDDVQVIDDETFDQKRFLELVKACPECPKTACDADDIYVITLSSKLSGTYNSALIGKQMYEEEYGRKNIAIIDSWSASAGELRQALFIEELCKAGVPFEEVVKQVEDFKTNRMQTFFVLETLDALRKNGRLTGLQAFFATTLNIKPVMGAEQGTIIKLDQARGINKALSRMCSIAVKSVPDPENRIPVVAHCNNPERAQLMKEELLKLVPFKKVVITKTAGVATVYASDGGIVLAL